MNYEVNSYINNLKQMFETNTWVMLFGDIGTGKTYSAREIRFMAMALGYSTAIYSIYELDSTPYKQVINDLENTDFLIIDDIFLLTHISVLKRIIKIREKTNKPLIIVLCTGNQDVVKDIREYIGAENIKTIGLFGESFRIKIAEEKNKFMKDFLGV